MKKLRTYSYISIAAQVLSTGLAWVLNGDIISSIAIAMLIPLSFAALGMAARQVIQDHMSRSILRIASLLLVALSAAAIVLAIFGDRPSAAMHWSVAGEAITVAGIVSALLIVAVSYALWRAQIISFAVSVVGLIAASGIIASNIDSIDLMVIAASRAVMILFLVLLAQSLDPSYTTS